MINSRLIDKSFRKEAQKSGVQVIVYEGGESSRFEDFAIEEGIEEPCGSCAGSRCVWTPCRASVR